MFQKSKGKDDLDILARRATDKVGDVETKIGPNLKIKGEIEGRDNVRLEGKFEGNANIGGLFFVGPQGDFKGELTADHVIIEGTCKGNVSAKKKIELRTSAKFHGNIASNTIAIAEGSFFEGEIKMNETEGAKEFSFEEKRKIKT